MSHHSLGMGDLEFLQAMMKRGFVNIPRMLYDYIVDLGLDYDTVGEIFAVLACVGGPTEVPFGSYVVSRSTNPKDFNQLRGLIRTLEQKDLVLSEEDGDELRFSFIPLFSRLRAIWHQYREQYEEDLAQGVANPSLLAAERLLGRPLSDREVRDIQEWMTAYDFGPEMVEAVIREGLRQGVTRMSYLNKVAEQWFDDGVRTPQEAEEYTQRYRKSAGKHKSIIQYLGIKRQLSAAEQALLDKWTDEWGFSNEVIIRACEQAAGAQNPLQYINAVLERWLAKGVKTVADAEQALTEHKRRSSADSPGKAGRARKAPPKSNVNLQRQKKDDQYYDLIFKKFGE